MSETRQRVGITLTIFTEDEKYMEYITNPLNSLIDYIGKRLNYKTLNFITGKHIKSNRPHFHICINYQHLDENTKKYKILNQKIQHLIKEYAIIEQDVYNQLPIDPNSILKAIKVSTIYEDEVKIKKGKTVKYDKHFIKYALKEYENIENINLELNKNNNLTIEEMEEYRDLANNQWKQIYKTQLSELEYQKKQKETRQRLFEYLALELKTSGFEKLENYNYHGLNNIIKFTILKIIIFKKQENEKTIRLYSLKDIAITFLYYHEYITAKDIVGLINIGL